MFDIVSWYYTATTSRLSGGPRVVECSDFESTLVNIQKSNVEKLKKKEKDYVCFLCAFVRSNTALYIGQAFAGITIKAPGILKQINTHVDVHYTVQTTNSV